MRCLPNYFQVVEFLLQCGFSVSSRNNEGKTPLHTAAVKVMIITIIAVIIIVIITIVIIIVIIMTTIMVTIINIINEGKTGMQGEDEDEMQMPGESCVLVGIRLSDPYPPLCVRPG